MSEKKLIRWAIIVEVIVIIMVVLLVRVYNSIGTTPNYTVDIFDDGSAKIFVDNIAYVNQLPDGTLVIDGGGEPEEYRYTRRDVLR